MLAKKACMRADVPIASKSQERTDREKEKQ